MKNEVLYREGVLTIIYPHYMEKGCLYSDLFDWLGDSDIVTASEIGKDCICMAGEVFHFTDADEERLKADGQVSLKKVELLEKVLDFHNEAHNDFYKWYNHIE